MTDFVRRLVSGNKARFKDHKLDVELDLVYLTDQVIIMGYPASGVEGLYRNPREDVKKFLEHRHGKNYWIFNFCPIKENSYDAKYFEGRVSRYPFPDHHAPPLAIMPLVAREMKMWLDGSPERVAVLHCKAGKGRSGTMACTYLLSLDVAPTIPKLERSYNAKDWATRRADEAMDVVPPDDDAVTIPQSDQSSEVIVESPVQDTSVESPTPHKPSKATLTDILDLHTSRRMRQPSSPEKKVKQGVSIPSQRRWLHYWSLLLSHQAPEHVWSSAPLAPSSSSPSLSSMPPESRRNAPKVRLTEVKLRMKESSGMTMNLVRAANAFLERGKGSSQVWVSLARYDDSLVEVLERWERYTRDEDGDLGKRKPGTGHFGEEALNEMFKEEKWDGEKMVRSFARLGCLDDKAVVKSELEDEKHEKIITYTLNPLSDKRWKKIQDQLEKAKKGEAVVNPEDFNIPASEANSMYDLTESVKDRGVVLDASREVRVKLYMGQIFMGWAWFVPTFHMPQPPPSNGNTPPEPTKLKLTRKDIDFPLGVGSSIIDVEISLEWLARADTERVQPPAVATPAEEKEAGGIEPMGLASVAQAATTPGQGLATVVEAKQAGED